MHEAAEHGEAHDNLQGGVIIISLLALYALTTLCETRSGQMLGLQRYRTVYAKPPGIYYHFSRA